MKTNKSKQELIQEIDELHKQVQVLTTINKTLESNRKEFKLEMELFRRLINQSREGLFLIDPKTSNILEVNDECCKRLGYEREELLNMKIIEIAVGLSDEQKWKKFMNKINSGIIWEKDRANRRKDGSTYPVSIYVSLLDIGGKDYVFASTRDITKKKELENKLYQYTENLEKEVKVRTKELKANNKELERLNDLFVGREFRIKELRDKVKDLEKTLNSKQ